MIYINSTPSSPHPIRAAGGLVQRTQHIGVIELLIVHRPKYDDWSLPKGKLHSNETWRSAAVREVHEETSITPVIHDLAGVMTYPIEHRFKIVFYWRMNVAHQKSFKPNDEIDKIQWVNQENFSTILTYPSEIKFILKAKIF